MFKAVCVSASLSLSAFAAVLLASPRRGVGGGRGHGQLRSSSPADKENRRGAVETLSCRSGLDQPDSERASE